MHDEDDVTFKGLFLPLTTKKVIVFLFLIGFVVFFNGLFNGFVGDDNGQIIINDIIRSVSNIPNFFITSTFNLGNGISGFYFKPLLLTIFTLIYSVFGLSPFPFHFFQILIFISNSVFVFLLFKKFFKQELAFILSVIFLVHPINQEVAAYISNYQDILFFFFGMLALLFQIESSYKYKRVMVFILLALSLLSKETGIVFLFINLTYVFIFKREQIKITILDTLFLIIPYFLIRTHAVGFKTPQDFNIGRASFLERIINIPKMIYFYLTTFIYPMDLAISYDWIVKKINFINLYLPLSVVLVFIGGIFWTAKRLLLKKSKQFLIFIFFCAWFFLGLGIHLQLIPLDGTVATRWFYLPIVGLLGMFGVIYQNFVVNKNMQKLFVYAVTMLVIIFSIRTILRNADFKDSLTLMCHDANITHDNFTLENACGVSHLAIGSLDKAQTHLERSVLLAPHYGINYWGLGAALGRKAELNKDKKLYNKAVDSFKTAIKITPSISWSYESLGYLYAHYDDTNTAREFLTSALKKFPNTYGLWLNYAYVEYKVGNREEALSAIKNAYILNPNDRLINEYYLKLNSGLPIKIEKSIF